MMRLLVNEEKTKYEIAERATALEKCHQGLDFGSIILEREGILSIKNDDSTNLKIIKRISK